MFQSSLEEFLMRKLLRYCENIVKKSFTLKKSKEFCRKLKSNLLRKGKGIDKIHARIVLALGSGAYPHE